jgi:hypothetical protein
MPRRAATETASDTVRVTVRVPRAEAPRPREIAAEMRQAERRPKSDRFGEGPEIDDETWAMFEEAIARPTAPHPRDVERAEEVQRLLGDIALEEIEAATERPRR